MTLSAILISLQGLLFKKIRLRQFKKVHQQQLKCDTIRDIHQLALIISKGLDLVSRAFKCYMGHSRIPKTFFGPNISLFVVTRQLTVAQNRDCLALKSQILAIIGLRKWLNMAKMILMCSAHQDLTFGTKFMSNKLCVEIWRLKIGEIC